MAGSTEAPVAIRGAALAIAGIEAGGVQLHGRARYDHCQRFGTHIAGSLGISTSQESGSSRPIPWREAICVPLTGWLAGRFGAVRTFIFCMMGFGIFSMLCGMSPTLGMLWPAGSGRTVRWAADAVADALLMRIFSAGTA
jgi:DHA2 family multidrug resistance protein